MPYKPDTKERVSGPTLATNSEGFEWESANGRTFSIDRMPDDSIEFYLDDGTNDRERKSWLSLSFEAEDAPDLLVGLQAWLDQLKPRKPNA